MMECQLQDLVGRLTDCSSSPEVLRDNVIKSLGVMTRLVADEALLEYVVTFLRSTLGFVDEEMFVDRFEIMRDDSTWFFRRYDASTVSESPAVGSPCSSR